MLRKAGVVSMSKKYLPLRVCWQIKSELTWVAAEREGLSMNLGLAKERKYAFAYFKDATKIK